MLTQAELHRMGVIIAGLTAVAGVSLGTRGIVIIQGLAEIVDSVAKETTGVTSKDCFINEKENTNVKKMLSLMMCLCFAVTVSGCGTLIHGTTQNISIQSDPAGATARLSTGYEVQTPDTVTLSRAKDYVVTFEKDGYQKKQVQINRHFNARASILGNILWLIVGVVIDMVSGGAWELEPEAINVKLQKA